MEDLRSSLGHYRDGASVEHQRRTDEKSQMEIVENIRRSCQTVRNAFLLMYCIIQEYLNL